MVKFVLLCASIQTCEANIAMGLNSSELVVKENISSAECQEFIHTYNQAKAVDPEKYGGYFAVCRRM